jgi:hypothetical protein
MSQAPSSRKPAGGCLRFVIGLLLALPALNALVLFVPMLTEGFPAAATEEERLLLRLFTGATVLVFGGGSIALLVSGGRAIGRRRVFQTQTEAGHPDEPWLWRPDWASGRIVSGGPPIGLTVIAVVWNAFVWKVVAAEPLRVILERRWDLLPFQIVPAVFLALGLHLARVAVREMARWLRFRPVSFRLETLPGVIGGRFRGWIEAGGALPAGAEVVVGISCTRATKKGSKTRREVVWQDERPAHSSSLFADSLAIPIEFAIPSGLPESSMGLDFPRHTWKLRARARIAGPDFEAEFEIPVFSGESRRAREDRGEEGEGHR